MRIGGINEHSVLRNAAARHSRSSSKPTKKALTLYLLDPTQERGPVEMIRGQRVADVVLCCMRMEPFCFRIAFGCVEQIDGSVQFDS